MKKILLTILAMMSLGTMAQQTNWKRVLKTQEPEFFLTDEARRVGEQVLLYQRVTGGWAKNIDIVRPLSDEEKKQVMEEKERRDDSTTDNGATHMQMTYLARLYKATHEERYREAFVRGVEYLLSGQYSNGGWPQFWPVQRDYQIHITYNDDAMTNTMRLLLAILNEEAPYDSNLTSKALKKRVGKAFKKGIDCIVATQIRVDENGRVTSERKGTPTVWCQQHDRETLMPAPARAYELPSYCSQESASIVELLMLVPNPSAEVKAAVHGAMAWFEAHKILGYRQVVTWQGDNRDKRLVPDANAKPLWARYYDLERCEPFVCDRDGVPRRHLHEIGIERRMGYSWYNDHPAALYEKYREWAKKNDPKKRPTPALS